jgi:hypothetical protein
MPLSWLKFLIKVYLIVRRNLSNKLDTAPTVLRSVNKVPAFVIAYKYMYNIVFVCKAHYYNCVLNELGINSTFGNPTYTPTALSKDEILQNHRSVLDTFNIPANGMNEFELPYLY